MDSPLRLRPAGPEDEAFLLALRRDTMNEHLLRAGEATDDDSHLARLRLNYAHACVVELRGQPVGLLKLVREAGPRGWYLNQIQLLPALHGQGLGEALLRQAMRAAGAAGVGLHLSVLRGNPALRLYQRVGFVEYRSDERNHYLHWPGST